MVRFVREASFLKIHVLTRDLLFSFFVNKSTQNAVRFPTENSMSIVDIANDIVAFLFSLHTTQSTGQLHILGHDRDTFGMNRTQVAIFKQTH